jgi:Cytochrome P450
VKQFFLAGTDTVGGVMSWLMYELATHQTVQDKLRAEILTVITQGDSLILSRYIVHMYFKEIQVLHLRLQCSMHQNCTSLCVLHRMLMIGVLIYRSYTVCVSQLTTCSRATQLCTYTDDVYVLHGVWMHMMLSFHKQRVLLQAMTSHGIRY